MSQTNETTNKIIALLFRDGIFAYRSSAVGIYDGRNNSYRTAAKVGIPDITAILFPLGRVLFIEVKTGSDRMRPEQIGFKANAERMGALHMTVKTFNDFEEQWNLLQKKLNN